ncbi:hypothetical protein KSF78_0008530 [Schistosoma japonicum]|nr:hypothetical protein KSF78_0008530 [Schistosoma japonicum]
MSPFKSVHECDKISIVLFSLKDYSKSY